MSKSKGRHNNRKKPGIARRNANKQILPALAAVGTACGLAASPAAALELGVARVDSSLGQPLRASIAYALAPNEELYDYCIFLNHAESADGIPIVSNVRVTITDEAIVLSGRVPIREPMLDLKLSVKCAYTARLARDYTLMIDPALPSESERAVLSTERPPLAPVAVTSVAVSDIPADIAPAPRIRRPAPRPQDDSPLAANSRYLVQPGDSVSQIASRIEHRSIALWPAVDRIFAANPHAFLDHDPNLLKAGSWLDIPDMSGAAAVVAARDTAPAPRQAAPAPVATADSSTAPGETPLAAAYTQSTPVEPEPVSQVPDAANEVEQPATTALADAGPTVSPLAEASQPELQPGDFVVGSDNPFVVPVDDDEHVIDIPDSTIEALPLAQPVPAVAVSAKDDGGISGSWSWLLWLGGAGIALLLGLFMFGRQIRWRFNARSYAIPDVPSRRRDDQPTPRSIVADIDFNFDADTLTPRKIELDADLDDGSGLQDVAELDVAQDFGYSATDTSVDVEIPEEAARQEKPSPTDVIPPKLRETDTILESEILPEMEDDENYSMSMEVDATKLLLDDNTVTTRDLQAILVSTDVRDKDSFDSGEYSLSRQMDYQILEQDYEEELTATQALNKQIEEAARALAEEMGEFDPTSETSEMPARDDPEITAELKAKLQTSGDAENEEFGHTDAALDLTADLAAAADDPTVDVATVGIGSKKSEAS